MFLYVFKRLAEMIPVLLVVVVTTFFLAHAVPGGPFDKERPMPAEVKKQVEAYYGLDQPLHVQLGNYIGNLSRGSLGPSMKYPGWTVNQIIGERIPVSVVLGHPHRGDCGVPPEYLDGPRAHGVCVDWYLCAVLCFRTFARFGFLAPARLVSAVRLGFGVPPRAAFVGFGPHHRCALSALDAR